MSSDLHHGTALMVVNNMDRFCHKLESDLRQFENSFSAIDAGVSQVVITLASAIHQEGCGTVIKK